MWVTQRGVEVLILVTGGSILLFGICGSDQTLSLDDRSSISERTPAFVAAANDALESFVKDLEDADPDNFAKNCEDLSTVLSDAIESEEFSAEQKPEDSVSPAHATVAEKTQDYLRGSEKLKPLARTFTELLTEAGGGTRATTVEVKVFVDQLQESLKKHFRSLPNASGKKQIRAV